MGQDRVQYSETALNAHRRAAVINNKDGSQCWAFQPRRVLVEPERVVVETDTDAFGAPIAPKFFFKTHHKVRGVCLLCLQHCCSFVSLHLFPIHIVFTCSFLVLFSPLLDEKNTMI